MKGISYTTFILALMATEPVANNTTMKVPIISTKNLFLI